MEIRVEKEVENVDLVAGKIVAEQLKKKPASAFIFPTGQTPLGLYANLVSLFKKGKIDFKNAQIFNLDEYYPIKHQNPASYFYYMKKNLIDQINIRLENWHIPNGKAASPQKEAEKYEKEIKQVGKFDLAVLGLGPGTTCHIGFNEPPSSLDSVARYMSLSRQTLKVNSTLFTNPQDIPTGALTMGIADIFRAKKVVLIAKGRHKALGVKIALTGPISETAPASFLRLHPNVTFLLDQEAASDLPI